jgi:hypothetical protein
MMPKRIILVTYALIHDVLILVLLPISSYNMMCMAMFLITSLPERFEFTTEVMFYMTWSREALLHGSRVLINTVT